MADTDYGSDLMLASMGMSAISSLGTAFVQSNAIKANAAYQQTVAQTNASLADLEASETLEEGGFAASREELKTQANVGTARAMAGASGVDVNTGSAMLAQNSIRQAGTINEINTRLNAARAAWGYKTASIESSYQGQFAALTGKAQAGQTLLAGGMGAIEGPMQIEANYMRYTKWFGPGAGGYKPQIPTYDTSGTAGGAFNLSPSSMPNPTPMLMETGGLNI